MGKEKEINNTDSVLSEIINFTLAKYRPAPTIAEATLLKTTQEIIDSIRMFYPDAFISSKQLHSMLLEAGYKYDCVDDMQFVWLMKE